MTIILLIIIALCLIGCSTLGMRMFKNTYSWNDGPWLILNGNPESSITICWTTATMKESTLLWGKSESNMEHVIYSPKSKNHSITINNLSPGNSYFYTIEEKFFLSNRGKIFSFQTAEIKNSGKAVEFIIAGDLQPKNEYTIMTNRIMAEQIDRENPDYIIQLGDLVQIGSSDKAWHNLMKSLPVMASERVFLTVAGNHEYYIFHKNSNFRSFFPYDFPGDKGCYYSVDIGNIHISFLDPYDGGPAVMSSKMTDEQKQWFILDLENAVKKGSDWIFVVLHQAVLTNGEYPDDVKLRKWIFPVLSKFDVDAVFWGHAHLYEHWKYRYGENGYLMNPEDEPGRNYINYFCIGSSGASLESNYRLFTHRSFRNESHSWFNIQTEKMKNIKTVQHPWNRDVFFSGRIGVDQFNESDLHYYHIPSDKNGEYSDDPSVSYSTDNRWFGYQYGENTLHYAKLTVEKETCCLSIHYADGSILTGPDGSLPQKFILDKKNRNHLIKHGGL